MSYIKANAFSLIGMAVIAAIVGGCGKGDSTESPPSDPKGTAPAADLDKAPKIEVKVMADGLFFLDGKSATLADADQRFAELAKAKGVIWYYREEGHSDPPAVAMELMQLVAKHRLPITMSSRSDFSDTVDAQGLSHPRK